MLIREKLITADIVRELLDYDPSTGLFTRKQRDRCHYASDGSYKVSQARFAGKAAGYADRKGYIKIQILKYGQIMAHRLAWLYVYGEWPEGQIDHINQIKSDNRIENLRIADNKDNHRNMPRFKNNTSGHVGVYWLKNRSRWFSQIMVDGKNICLGLYRDKDDAIRARKEADVKYGFHTNHGTNSLDELKSAA